MGGPASPDSIPTPASIEAGLAEAAEESRDAPAAPPVEARRRGGGFLATLAGGLLAAVIGFAAARYVIPEGWPVTVESEPDPALANQIATQSRELAALKAQVSALSAATPAPTLDPARIAEMEGYLRERLSAEQRLSERMAALEARPVPEPAPGVAEAIPGDYAETLATLRRQIEEHGRRNDQLSAELANVTTAARDEQQKIAATIGSAAAEAAIARLAAAIEAGNSFGATLDQIRAQGLSVPDSLAAHSAGVPTLRDLIADFPRAARAALDAAAVPAAGEGTASRLSSFLQRQVGIRSLSPQEGTTPDAILSRAEAALASGDLRAALTEIDALPMPAKTAMADWRTEADVRQAALDAVQALIAQLAAK